MKKTLMIFVLGICSISNAAPVRSMVAARNTLLDNESLPISNVELEYVESSGKQWIVLPTSGVPGSYYSVSGHIFLSNPQNNKIIWRSNSQWFYSWGYSSGSGGTTYTFASQIGANTNNGGWSIRIGEMTYFEVSTKGITKLGVFVDNPRPIRSSFSQLYVFSGKDGATPISIRLKDLQIVSGDTLEYDLVAWIDENGIACLHDRISGNNFYSMGTEAFIAGPKKGN